MRILIIAPHADDEVLGCGGLIARRVREGHDVEVAVVTMGDVHLGGVVKSTAERRREELARAASILGIPEPAVLFPGYENRLDTLPRIDLIGRLDGLVAGRDQVFLPYASHHQDHRLVHDAGLAALRSRGRPGPSLVALYEYPYVGWPPEPVPGGHYYVDVGGVLDVKRTALLAYGSQACAAPHPIAWDSVEALARQRGIQAGCAHAELFYVLRMLDA
jgi:LmbE family N-acetylglucosaminyl deacetylase